MIRSDLAWQLFATIPHANAKGVVGLAVQAGESWTWATDGYTIALTRQDCDPDLDVEAWLPRSEALDLARALRPKNKAQEVEAVRFAVQPGELHVQVDGVLNVKDGGDTAVYDADADGPTLMGMMGWIRRLDGARVDTMPQVFDPELYARFADAKRSDGDGLTFWPRRTGDGKIGAGVVVVGDSLIGACMGLQREPAADVLRSFLSDREAA